MDGQSKSVISGGVIILAIVLIGANAKCAPRPEQIDPTPAVTSSR